MGKNNRNQIVRIICHVYPGMFSAEWGVAIKLHDNSVISALVDKKDVLVKKEPQPGSKVDGTLRVYIVQRSKESVVFDLPQPALAAGTRLEVPKQYFETTLLSPASK